MERATETTVREIARITRRRRLGPDAQVDDKALIIAPDAPLRTDPFLALSEDWFSAPGFDWHPHRGIETVTTVLDGVLEHGDNLGNAGALEPGDVQWMTAGRGIIHRELAFRNERAHTLQLWVNLPAARKLTATRYQDLRSANRPRRHAPGIILEVISGVVDGVAASTLTHSDIQGAHLTLEAAAAFAYPLPAAHRAFVHVLAGRAMVADRDLPAGETAWSDPVAGAESTLRLVGCDDETPTRLIVYSGTPLC